MVKSKVVQWGNSLAIKLPKSVREMVNLRKEDALCIYVTDNDELVIKKDDGNITYDAYKAGNIL